MSTLIGYNAGTSSFHKMAPLPKFVAALVLTGFSVAAPSIPAQCLLLFAVVIAGVFGANIRIDQLASLALWVLLFILSYFVINVVAGIGTTPLLDLGGLIITREAVDNAGTVALRWMLFLSLSIIFISTTDPLLFARALSSQWKLPNGASLIVFLALRMADIYERELRALLRTHRLRYHASQRGLSARAAMILRLVRGLLARGFGRAQTLAASMTLRGAELASPVEADARMALGWRDIACLCAAILLGLVCLMLA